MAKFLPAAACGLLFTLQTTGHAAAPAHAGSCVDSPQAVLTVCVVADAKGPRYDVYRKSAAGERAVITQAKMGLVLEGFGNEPATRVGDERRSSVNSSWEQPWGEQRQIQDRHNQLVVTLTGADATRTEPYDLTIRAFDDGFGFRYEFKNVAASRDVAILDELTEFRLASDYDAWWYPARFADRDEYLYKRDKLFAVDLAETPLTLQSPGLYISIHEAAMVDYASMNLRRTAERTLKADLMPWSDGVLVRKRGPFTTPWRTVLVGETPAALADSRIELNLNEPNKLGDTSWVALGKYVGIWWEMHLNRSTWGSGDKHGANNANVKRYIDFAAKHGFGGVLVEGWNKGWDGDWIANGKHFSFTESYPDFDLPMLAAYAKERGVRIIGHNETAGAVENYERQLEDAMTLYAKNHVAVVKTGYVKPSGSLERTLEDGSIGHEWFAGQFRVRHELKVAEVAAKHRISIDAHEPVKDTGLRRTWPNMLSREGARGQEFNAWGRPTNPPEHLTILPFTRMLAGPMDFTPGIFDITFGKDKLEERVQSTLATQLAEYVLLYSPVHMAADLPENYEARPDAFQFIKDVPTDWETSRTLAGEIGEYVVIVRKQRGGRDWYLGATTDENARQVSVPLEFLERGKRFEAQIYRDAPDADFRTNPTALVIEKKVVTSKDTLPVSMAPGGGIAVRFRAL